MSHKNHRRPKDKPYNIAAAYKSTQRVYSSCKPGARSDWFNLHTRKRRARDRMAMHRKDWDYFSRLDLPVNWWDWW